MPNKIFHTPPLGNLSDTPQALSSQATSARVATPAPKKRKAATPKIPDIPMPPAYRVIPLARYNGASTASGHGDKWRTQAMRSHRVPTLIWFTRGQGRFTMSGVTRGFGPHNLVYLPPRTMYGFEPIGQISGYIVHLPQVNEMEWPEEPLHLRFTEVIQQNEITGLIENLAREIDNDQPGHDRALALQAGMISVWLERQMSVMPEYELTPDASRRLVAAYTALIEEKFHETHTVSDYATALGVTATHLTRACNIANGHPASKILADRVHFEARRMLKETDLPVKDIAAKLGFHSPAYFSRSFHKATGVSPRQFRQSC
ncbi:helix-turn-helix domain-containing protein [Celeribacter sp.]|uniref:helix-turn-helix domain-containing protein n=1 Tax=Celeribacter sp. TaxID=1890673 RepID=UPI003A8FF622